MYKNVRLFSSGESSDEREHIRELFHIFDGHEHKSYILNLFERGKLNLIAEYLGGLEKDKRKLQDILDSERRTIELYENRIRELEWTIRMLERQIRQMNELGNYKNYKEGLEIVQLYRQGLSCRKIGERLGRDKSTIKRRLKQMGVIKEE